MSPTPNPSRQRAAIFALTSVCLFWGSTFLLMKLGTKDLIRIFGKDWELASGPFFLLCRFALACVLLPIFLPRCVRGLDRATWTWGFWLSTVFSVGFFLQVFGLARDDVSAGQSAFLTSLYVVSTPLLSSLFLRRFPPLGVWIGVALATLGAAYIKGPPDGGLSLGAWATIGCALAFGGHIIITDVATKRVDPIRVTFTMLVFSSLWMAIALAISPHGLSRLDGSNLAAAFTSAPFLITCALTSTLATCVALTVLNVWQRELPPARAAVVYTSEPVFATLISIAATALTPALVPEEAREEFSWWLVFGAVMILLANLSAEFIGRRPTVHVQTAT